VERPPVLVLHNQPRGPAADGSRRDAESDAGVLVEAAAVAAGLTELGVPHRLAAVRTLREAGREISSGREPCVINLVESLDGSATDACLVPAVCAALGKAWTGSGTACQLLALDKWQSKVAMRAAGIPVPVAAVLDAGDTDLPAFVPSATVIVKPLRADAGEGIDASSVLSGADRAAVLERAARIHRELHQPALIERYIEGREFNVALLERGGEVSVLPLAEIDFSAFPRHLPRIVDYRAKWIEDSFEYAHTIRRVPADVDQLAADAIRAAALAAWKRMGCRDYARVDMRLDAEGRPFVIEVNPNPDIAPDAGFASALHAAGISFAQFVAALLANAGQPVAPEPPPSRTSAPPADLQIAWSAPHDRQPILNLLKETGVFRPSELDVAREVLDDALAKGEGGHYQSFTATLDGAVVGWTCYGPTPCTAGAFDLYWIAVSPACHRRGVARALLARAESSIRARQGRLIVVETSSRSDYEPPRRFYERNGFRKAGVVEDFYEPGDHKLIYVKSPGP